MRHRLAALLKLHFKARQPQLERETVFKSFGNERSIVAKIKDQAVLDRTVCDVTIGDARKPLDKIKRQFACLYETFLFVVTRLQPGCRPRWICEEINRTCHNECPKSERPRRLDCE